MAIEIALPGPADVSRTARTLAVLAWAAVVATTLLAFRSFEPNPPHLAVQVVLGVLWGFPVALIVIALNFVYIDAKRRGMNAGGWTLLAALLLPGAIGFVLYFLFRKPIRTSCPQCHAGVRETANYCPACGFAVHPSCPSCGKPTRSEDGFCEACGRKLR